VFSVGGIAAGTIGALATGFLFLIPLTAIAGIIADHERCSRCGAPSDHANPVYRPMRSEEDQLGSQTFVSRPLNPHKGQASRFSERPPRTEPRPSDQARLKRLGDASAGETADSPLSPPDSGGEETENHDEAGERYVWDDTTSKFVPHTGGAALLPGVPDSDEPSLFLSDLDAGFGDSASLWDDSLEFPDEWPASEGPE